MKLDKFSIGIIILIVVFLYMTYNEITQSNQIEQSNQLNHLNQLNQLNQLNEQNKSSKLKKKKKHKKLKPAIKKEKKNKKKKKVKFNIPDDTDQDLIFMDIGTDTKYYGKIKIKLFSKIVPKTCDNFRTLCKTKKYYNSPFHRIIKDFMIQGGDYTQGNGRGGASIYGTKFPDENFNLKHDRPYLLSMANSGPNTNGSQFFITTDRTSHLDGRHVVFGEIESGFDIVDQLNVLTTDQNDCPYEKVKILNCGIVTN